MKSATSDERFVRVSYMTDAVMWFVRVTGRCGSVVRVGNEKYMWFVGMRCIMIIWRKVGYQANTDHLIVHVRYTCM